MYLTGLQCSLSEVFWHIVWRISFAAVLLPCHQSQWHCAITFIQECAALAGSGPWRLALRNAVHYPKWFCCCNLMVKCCLKPTWIHYPVASSFFLGVWAVLGHRAWIPVLCPGMDYWPDTAGKVSRYHPQKQLKHLQLWYIFFDFSLWRESGEKREANMFIIEP